MKNWIIILITVFTIACSSNENQSDTAKTEEVVTNIAQSFSTEDTIKVVASGETMAEIKFDKKVIRVPENKEITIALTNESTDATMPHNMVIINAGTEDAVGQNGISYKNNSFVNPDDENVIAHSDLAQIGTTVYFSFTTPTAGEYEFICSYPGHWGLMKGSFITK